MSTRWTQKEAELVKAHHKEKSDEQLVEMLANVEGGRALHSVKAYRIKQGWLKNTGDKFFCPEAIAWLKKEGAGLSRTEQEDGLRDRGWWLSKSKFNKMVKKHTIGHRPKTLGNYLPSDSGKIVITEEIAQAEMRMFGGPPLCEREGAKV
jgi:hypothetical protein